MSKMMTIILYYIILYYIILYLIKIYRYLSFLYSPDTLQPQIKFALTLLQIPLKCFKNSDMSPLCNSKQAYILTTLNLNTYGRHYFKSYTQTNLKKAYTILTRCYISVYQPMFWNTACSSHTFNCTFMSTLLSHYYFKQGQIERVTL